LFSALSVELFEDDNSGKHRPQIFVGE